MAEHFCTEHNTKYYKNEKNGKVWYSHKIQGEDGYCNEPQPQKAKQSPGVEDTATPGMTKADWSEKDRATRKSIERQTALNASVEIAKVLGADKISAVRVISTARLFESYLESGKVPEAPKS